MPDAAHYHAVDTLRDGRRITIRAFAPADRDALTATVARISPLSLYRRFFTIKRARCARLVQLLMWWGVGGGQVGRMMRLGINPPVVPG